MKGGPSIILVILLCSLQGMAQQAISVTYNRTYTKGAIDTILARNGAGGGFIATKYDVKVYTVFYNTVATDSTPIIASGLMIVPIGAPCKVPMLSYQHDNITRRTDAPTFFRNEWFVGLAVSSVGFIAVLPDGLGMGSAGFGYGHHPFLHLQSAATSVIDLIRAAKQVADSTGAIPNRQLFLAGYSEGGYNSMAAHQYIQRYFDTSLHVTATAAIAGYYDMSGSMVQQILSDSIHPEPSYLPALIYGYNDAYHFFTADSQIFVHPYDTILPRLFNGTYSDYYINSIIPKVVKTMLQPRFIDSLKNDSNFYFKKLLQKNDAYHWRPNSRLTLYFCPDDEIVPASNTAVAMKNFNSYGSNRADSLNVGSGVTHFYCAQFSVLGALNLFSTIVVKPVSLSLRAYQIDALRPTGAIRAKAVDGFSPYQYTWSNGSTSDSVDGLAAGKYYVTITDSTQCSYTDSVVIKNTTGVENIEANQINIYPNPTRNHLFITCGNINIDEISLHDMNGNLVFKQTFTSTSIVNLDTHSYSSGVYILIITDSSGNHIRQKIILL